MSETILSLADPGVVPTRYWHLRPDGRVQCDLCPRACKLHEGQRGLCYVRARVADSIVLTSYGRSSGFCVDPIEKKPLYHFLPGTTVFSFGTAGCNLACRFCQNWDISKVRQDDVLSSQASPSAIAAAAVRAGCPSVAFTYNDPVVFHEYAVDTAAACRAAGLRTVAVTAGYVEPEPRSEFYEVMDAANIDLKAFTDDFYRRYCGGRLEPVLDTLAYVVHETPVWVEITTLLIPGLNDGPDEIDRMTRWVRESLGRDVPHHFTAFHRAFRLTDRPPTPRATLHRAREIALANGLRHVYTGNVHDPDGHATSCGRCGQRLIGRDRYRITSNRLTPSGNCPACGERCPGVVDDPAASGRRRTI